MFVRYFKEENTLRFWRLCGEPDETALRAAYVSSFTMRLGVVY